MILYIQIKFISLDTGIIIFESMNVNIYNMPEKTLEEWRELAIKAWDMLGQAHRAEKICTDEIKELRERNYKLLEELEELKQKYKE